MIKTNRKLWVAVFVVAALLVVVTSAGGEGSPLLMPLIFEGGHYPGAPTYTPTSTSTSIPTSTPTRTPKPPTAIPPPPTATPTYVLREGANTCGVALGAGVNPEDGGTSLGSLVPGLCSFVEFYEEQLGGTVLVVKANGIKIDTWGCMEGDFGYWPPVESDCPPEEPFFSEWGQILWGDLEIAHFENSYQAVCFHCAECDNETHTYNCVEVSRPSTMAELHDIISGKEVSDGQK